MYTCGSSQKSGAPWQNTQIPKGRALIVRRPTDRTSQFPETATQVHVHIYTYIHMPPQDQRVQWFSCPIQRQKESRESESGKERERDRERSSPFAVSSPKDEKNTYSREAMGPQKQRGSCYIIIVSLERLKHLFSRDWSRRALILSAK